MKTLDDVTGTKGTLRRNLQLKELTRQRVEAADDDADFFNSTPLRAVKQVKVRQCRPSSEADETLLGGIL